MPNLENTEKLLMKQVRAVRQGELNNEYENWDKVNNGDMLKFDWSKNLYELQISTKTVSDVSSNYMYYIYFPLESIKLKN